MANSAEFLGMHKMIFITNEEIVANLTWDELMPLIEDGMKRYSRHDSSVIQPLRTSFAIPQHSSVFYSMPCYSEQEDVICTKLLMANPHNAEKGLPSHNSIVHLFQGSTGKPLAVLDGDAITAWRTACSSLIATKLLATGTPKILTIIGAGVQARSHFQALSHLYHFDEIRVWNVTASTSAQTFVQEIQEAGHNGILCETVEAAVANADVICTATLSDEPLLKLAWIKSGAHINAIGANRFNKQEIHPDLMKEAVVYVECSKHALQESGDIIQSRIKIYAEIGEVLDGKKEADRDKITIFKSSGMAIEDAVTAALVYKKIQERKNMS